MFGNRKKMTEDGCQMTENGGQKAEDRRKMVLDFG